MTDSKDNNNFSFTNFDEERLKDLEINNKLSAENASWEVFRYNKDYISFVFQPKYESVSFTELNKLIDYLKNKNPKY